MTMRLNRFPKRTFTEKTLTILSVLSLSMLLSHFSTASDKDKNSSLATPKMKQQHPGAKSNLSSQQTTKSLNGKISKASTPQTNLPQLTIDDFLSALSALENAKEAIEKEVASLVPYHPRNLENLMASIEKEYSALLPPYSPEHLRKFTGKPSPFIDMRVLLALSNSEECDAETKQRIKNIPSWTFDEYKKQKKKKIEESIKKETEEAKKNPDQYTEKKAALEKTAQEEEKAKKADEHNLKITVEQDKAFMLAVLKALTDWLPASSPDSDRDILSHWWRTLPSEIARSQNVIDLRNELQKKSQLERQNDKILNHLNKIFVEDILSWANTHSQHLMAVFIDLISKNQTLKNLKEEVDRGDTELNAILSSNVIKQIEDYVRSTLISHTQPLAKQITLPSSAAPEKPQDSNIKETDTNGDASTVIQTVFKEAFNKTPNFPKEQKSDVLDEKHDQLVAFHEIVFNMMTQATDSLLQQVPDQLFWLRMEHASSHTTEDAQENKILVDIAMVKKFLEDMTSPPVQPSGIKSWIPSYGFKRPATQPIYITFDEERRKEWKVKYYREVKKDLSVFKKFSKSWLVTLTKGKWKVVETKKTSFQESQVEYRARPLPKSVITTPAIFDQVEETKSKKAAVLQQLLALRNYDRVYQNTKDSTLADILKLSKRVLWVSELPRAFAYTSGIQGPILFNKLLKYFYQFGVLIKAEQKKRLYFDKSDLGELLKPDRLSYQYNSNPRQMLRERFSISGSSSSNQTQEKPTTSEHKD